MRGRKVLGFRADPKVEEALDKIAVLTGLTHSAIVRWLILREAALEPADPGSIREPELLQSVVQVEEVLNA